MILGLAMNTNTSIDTYLDQSIYEIKKWVETFETIRKEGGKD